MLERGKGAVDVVDRFLDLRGYLIVRFALKLLVIPG